MSVRRYIVLMAYFLTFIAFATTKGHYNSDKRIQGPSFHASMRYGRSGRGVINGGEQRNKVVVSPRAETFYLGPRYGKRATIPSDALYSPAPSLCDPEENLSCVYTGLSDIYRCALRKYGANDVISPSE